MVAVARQSVVHNGAGNRPAEAAGGTAAGADYVGGRISTDNISIMEILIGNFRLIGD